MRLDLMQNLPKCGAVYPFVWFGPKEITIHLDLIEPFLEKSVKHSQGTVTVKGLIDGLLAADYTVIGVAEDAEPISIFVCRIVPYETYKAARIVAAAGRGLKEAHRFIGVLEEWAFSQGAVELEGWCRPGVVRVLQRLGWKPKFTIVTYDLRRKLQ